MVRNAKLQFDRRGGFVRIFPAADTWAKYSQYLGRKNAIKILRNLFFFFFCLCNIDPTTGVPIIGPVSSSYSVSTPHNYNQILFTQLFPHVPLSTTNKYERGSSHQRFCSLDRKRDGSLDSNTIRKYLQENNYNF